MTMDFGFFNNLINNALIQLHTAYIAKVVSITGKTAKVVPLTYSKDVKGNLVEQAPVTAYVCPNAKCETKDLTYVADVIHGSGDVVKETKKVSVLVPKSIEVNDIVLCVVCERDITYAVQGKMSEPSNRKHDMNDSVILKVL